MMRCDFSGFDLPADVYADGIGSVQNLGENFRTIFFVFAHSDGGVWQRVPMFCVVRPKSSILKKDGMIHRMLRGESDPRAPSDGEQLHS